MNTLSQKRVIGITMGCPVGVGPEILLDYLAEQAVTKKNDFLCTVFGDIGVLQQHAATLGKKELLFTPWTPQAPLPVNGIPVVEVSHLNPSDLQWGQPTAESGVAMAQYIEAAVEAAQSGYIDAMTTCPISKASLNNAGYEFPGHTEMLASLLRLPTEQSVMMMTGSRLRITLVTIHCALSEVSGLLTEQKIFELIATTASALRKDFSIPHPKIAIAALNPHAGEGGIFGNEEAQYITPAIQKARTLGLDAHGPFPPDTLFFTAASGKYDAVVCMYHDQGLIPFKLLHFTDGVNVTLGLPIVRTSVDHGTAYDIAGQGKADHRSLAAAVKLAAAISCNRQNSKERQP